MTSLDVSVLQGIPYVPGCAQGKPQRRVLSATAGDILIISQHELEPLTDQKPAALIVVDGAPFSHRMIQLINRGVPIVIISGQQANGLRDAGFIQVNGTTGEIRQSREPQSLACTIPDISEAGKPVRSKDGADVWLRASVSHVAGSAKALSHGAAAVGLVRSELLQPLATGIPDEAFYYQEFGAICDSAAPLPVTIRLLDLAPDKQPSWLQHISGMQGPLGMQGARLYRHETMRQVVEGQIAAIDNLAAHFKLQLIIPYITTLGEFRHWRDYVRTRLTHNIAVGAMAETPAALLDMNHWFDDADFVAIGTNDLMQCLFAADRDLPPLRHYLNPYAPFLFRLLHRAALDIGNRNHKVQVCGLMSQFPGILPLLLAMGYRAFSVEPTRIPYLAQTVTRTDVRATQHLVEQVYNASNAKAVCQLLDVPLPAIWSDE